MVASVISIARARCMSLKIFFEIDLTSSRSVLTF